MTLGDVEFSLGMTAIARSMFPNMPSVVFDIWLDPLIRADGWPFISEFAMPSGVWAQYFDGHSIQSIKNLLWERLPVFPMLHSFCPESRNIIQWIIQQHIHGVSTPVARIKKGKGGQSFFRSRDFIERTGRLHTPVVLIKETFGYKIMDGNHRIAALFSLSRPIWNFDAWIGK